MHGFLSPRRGLPLLLIPEYSGINKEEGIHDRSKTAHRKPLVKCFLTQYIIVFYYLFSFALGLRCSDRGYSSLHCSDFSLRWFLLFQSTGSRQQLWLAGLVALRHIGSSWTRGGTLVRALARGFLTTGPPGKSYNHFIRYPAACFS